MKRVQRRRYGRDSSVVAQKGATHRIVIGYTTTMKKNGKTIEIPAKLHGLLIHRDTLDAQNKPVPDWGAMANLGYSKEQISQAFQKGFKASESCLPQRLQFVLMSDAQQVSGEGWRYSDIFSEAYEHYGKEGMVCYGDGEHASQKMPDGSRRPIPCVPYGIEGIDPSQFCEFSGPGAPCKSHCRLTVCLYTSGPGGFSQPVCPELGRQALYRFDTTSEYTAIEILKELDRAANRVQGLLHALSGTLTFQKKARRTGTGKVIVGHVLFQIDDSAIERREQQIREAQENSYRLSMEGAKAGLDMPAPVLSLPAPDESPDPPPDAPIPPLQTHPPQAEKTPQSTANPAPTPTPDPQEPPQEALEAEILLENVKTDRDRALWLEQEAGRRAGVTGEDPAAVLTLMLSFRHGGDVKEPSSTAWFFQGASPSKINWRKKKLREIYTETVEGTKT